MSPPRAHYLLSTTPGWGHLKPLCVLATRIVQLREDTVVTILIAPNALDKAISELAAQFPDGSANKAFHRIRALSIFVAAENTSALKLFGMSTEAFAGVYKSLADAQPVICTSRGTVFDPVPAPATVILDFFCLPELKLIHEITGLSVPVFAWASGGASTIIRFFGDESIGGYGDFASKIEAEAARTGVTADELGNKFLKGGEGKLIEVPGVPAMYDYEFSPQKLAFDIPLFKLLSSSATFLKLCQGIVIASPYAYEGVSLEAVKRFFEGRKKDVYVVGPLLSPAPVPQVSDNTNDVEKFLGHKYEKYGKGSVIYVSFGTSFWPTAPEYVEEVIDALMEKEFPFIFSYASPAATLSDGLAEKVKSSGIGLLTKWSPQHYILNHPATGWFLTHAGHGSVMEALSSATPLICWPFGSDQPGAAAHLSENLKVAFELIEVRTGEPGLKPIHRIGRAPKGTREAVGAEIREVIDASRGQRGQAMRKNIEALRVQLQAAWGDEGAATKELKSFLEKYPN